MPSIVQAHNHSLINVSPFYCLIISNLLKPAYTVNQVRVFSIKS